MREIVGEEQLAARAMREEQAAEVMKRAAELEAEQLVNRRSSAARDASNTQAAEAVMVSLARKATAHTLSTLTSINAGLSKHASSLALRLKVDEDEPATFKQIDDAVRMLGSLAGALRQVTQSAQTLMELERATVGDPLDFTARGASQSTTREGMTPITLDEAERRVAIAARAIERAKAASSSG